ncbi:MAG: hypothetical protein ABSH36_14465 [Solirubrobacteraceae bacterium]
MRGRILSLVALTLLSVAMLWLGVVAGSARRVTRMAGARAIDLRIIYSEPRGGFGPERYSLRCDPASGTLPHAGVACEAIAREPELVLAGPGQDHSCPAGVSAVRVRGEYLGQYVDVDFSPCASQPGDPLERWLSLLPAALQHQERVRLDHGFGLFSLGERRGAVLSLLLRPQEQRAGISIYRPEVVEGVAQGSAPEVFGVGYDHAGRVVSLLSDWSGLEIHGFPITLQTPADETELIRQLKGWIHVRCGGVSGLMDHPSNRHVPRTVVWMAGEQATVSISDAGVAICSAATRSLIS